MTFEPPNLDPSKKTSFVTPQPKSVQSSTQEVARTDADLRHVSDPILRSNAQTTDHIPTERPVKMARSLSLPKLQGDLNEEEVEIECQKRTANGIWECKKRLPNKLGGGRGYVYGFLLRKEFDYFSALHIYSQPCGNSYLVVEVKLPCRV